MYCIRRWVLSSRLVVHRREIDIFLKRKQYLASADIRIGTKIAETVLVIHCLGRFYSQGSPSRTLLLYMWNSTASDLHTVDLMVALLNVNFCCFSFNHHLGAWLMVGLVIPDGWDSWDVPIHNVIHRINGLNKQTLGPTCTRSRFEDTMKNIGSGIHSFLIDCNLLFFFSRPSGNI